MLKLDQWLDFRCDTHLDINNSAARSVTSVILSTI